jgi:oxygen-independent coproporphyrinogen-3 oxidase
MHNPNKIACVMVGHRFVNEVQTVAQIFFPFYMYSFHFVDSLEEAGEESPIKIITWLENGNAFAILQVNNQVIASRSRALEDSGVIQAGLSPRRVLMLAVFSTLQDYMKKDVPWGALTGIRPSKAVRGWMDEGKTDNEILGIMRETLYCHEDKARLAITVAHAERRLTEKIYALGNSQKIPIGIYIGIPFCPSRCLYCSFNMNHKPPTREILQQYVNVLIRECREKEAEMRNKQANASSVYIGGGTPTVLPADLLERLLYTVQECFGTPYEYTVEAGRPDTLNAENVKLMRKYGVNRIAVNPQTLNNQTLAAIGRSHTAEDFFRAFALAREAGFPCINTDLIAGLPNETTADVNKNIEKLLPLAPENITLHALSIKRASRLNQERQNYHGDLQPSLQPSLPTPITTNNYAPYYLYRQKNTYNLSENIGYSLPNHECLYNIGMMSEVQTILGIGAGAVSKYIEGSKISRIFNEKNTDVYMQRR